MKISAFYDIPIVYSLITLPIVTDSMYEIITTTPLPVYDGNNIFTLLKLINTIIAINKESHNYLTLTETELKDCVKDNLNYICEKDYPMYRITMNALCEVKSTQKIQTI